MHLPANTSVQDITGELESRGFLNERRPSTLPPRTFKPAATFTRNGHYKLRTSPSRLHSASAQKRLRMIRCLSADDDCTRISIKHADRTRHWFRRKLGVRPLWILFSRLSNAVLTNCPRNHTYRNISTSYTRVDMCRVRN
uniref:Uncharacterized protein n=1 Tax=Rhipicephalus zambeziensis TaxID=60191 RepID=A0A224YCW3_9ACAR